MDDSLSVRCLEGRQGLLGLQAEATRGAIRIDLQRARRGLHLRSERRSSTPHVFFPGGPLDLSAASRALGFDTNRDPVADMYIIRNGQINPEPEQVERSLTKIASRAVESMIKSSVRGDLFRIYLFTSRQKVNFHYVDIPDDYKSLAQEAFDLNEMNRLFQLGYELGQRKDPWQKVPPGLERYIEE